MVNNGKLILIIEVTKKNCSFTLLLQYTYTKKKNMYNTNRRIQNGKNIDYGVEMTGKKLIN